VRRAYPRMLPRWSRSHRVIRSAAGVRNSRRGIGRARTVRAWPVHRPYPGGRAGAPPPRVLLRTGRPFIQELTWR